MQAMTRIRDFVRETLESLAWIVGAVLLLFLALAVIFPALLAAVGILIDRIIG